MAQDDEDDFQTNPDDINPMYLLKKDEVLPEDGDTPFSPPSGIRDRVDNTHPDTDDSVEASEDYNSGIEQASDVNLPEEELDDIVDEVNEDS